jgi:hypothetical protein
MLARWVPRSCLAGLALLGAVAVLLAATVSASAQSLVYPRRATQSHVRYQTFTWRYIDIWRGSNARGEPTWQAGPRRHARPLHAGHGLTAGAVAEAAPGVEAPGWLWERARTAALLAQRQAQPGNAGDAGRGAPLAYAIEPRPPAPATEPRPLASPPPPAAIRPEIQRRLGAESGGVRLYFYERERAVAERAAASIAETYVYLAEAFDHVPRRTLPYFLYSTYHEFLQTNLFPVEEGVLGVTSTIGLELALPYFGDHRQFVEISTHEMAHQFTIHKVRAAARAMKADSDPLEKLPLWLIEGIAEYYAQRGLDPRSEMIVRDIVLNPDLDKGYVMRDFLEERLNVVWTYKLGQARCAFLESEYGPGMLQRILAASPRLALDDDHARHVKDFRRLLEELTGEDAARISQRFQSWLKRRAYWTFLLGKHAPEALDYLAHAHGHVQALASSEDGALLLYRSIDAGSGRVELTLVDHRAPRRSEGVARDGVPGVDSLHPVARRNFDVRASALAFVAQSRDRDVIYWQTIRHRARKRKVREAVAPDAPLARPAGVAPLLEPWPPLRATQPRKPRVVERWNVELDLGRRRGYPLDRMGLIAAEAVALAPDGERLAFIAIDRTGQRDVYVLTPRARGATLARITSDVHAERHVIWGPRGIVFTSDATGHGKYNLFLARVAAADRADPADRADRGGAGDADGTPRAITRLTYAARDQADPVMLADGRLFFVAQDDYGANVYEHTATGVVRRSRVATGLHSLGAGPDGSLWTLHYHAGRLRPARLPRATWLDEPVATLTADDVPPAQPPAPMRLTGDRPYRALSLDNWTVGPVFAILGGSSQGLFGQGIAVASDRLRNHTLLFQILALGSWELIDTDLFYTNQEQRTIWGTGLFQNVSLRYDTTFADEGLLFTSAERFFGVNGVLRYPFDRFVYVQGGLAVGGVRHGLLELERLILSTPELNPAGRDLVPEWEAAHPGTDLRLDASASLGYNTLTYHVATGPVSGNSALIETRVMAEPLRSDVGASLRLDAEQYIPLGGATNIMLRLGAGETIRTLMPGFFLSSYDTLRAVNFGDASLLLGQSYLFSTAELQFPLNALITIRFLDLEGVLGADFGGVGEDFAEAWHKRVFDLVAGTNLGLGPLVLRLHFARPIDVGGRILPNDGDWNTSFSLGYRYQ